MSYEVEGTARPDLQLGGIRRCRVGKGPELSECGMTTLWEIFVASARASGARPCLGRRLDGVFVFESYAEVQARAVAFGNGLNALGLCARNSDGLRMLGLLGDNMPSWVVGELGCLSKRVVSVPLYATLGDAAVAAILRSTELNTVMACSAELHKLLRGPAEVLSGVRALVLMDSEYVAHGAIVAAELRQACQARGLLLLTVEEVEAAGERRASPPEVPWARDLAYICFTSGTTGGDPKGVMVTHENVIASLVSLRAHDMDFFATDVHLSYLPLAHVFERTVLFGMLRSGASIGFLMDDTKRILDAIVALRPTVFPTVPRLLNKMFDKIVAGVEQAPPLKQAVFRQALLAKLEGLHGISAADKVRAAAQIVAERAAASARSARESSAKHALNATSTTTSTSTSVGSNSDEDSEASSGESEPEPCEPCEPCEPPEPCSSVAGSGGAARLAQLGRALADAVGAESAKLSHDAALAGGLQQLVLQRAKANGGSAKGRLAHPVWDRVVFAPIKRKLGFDRLRVLMCGSAPLASDVLDFFRALLGVEVIEGYGQSESTCIITTTVPGDYSSGHVGVPAPCCEVRLVGLPEMGYNSFDTEHKGEKVLGRGEICFRGANAFAGYYRLPGKTAEAKDAEGFVHTGDIGVWTADGKLKIVDRVKSLLKLSFGEYVAPERVENALTAHPLVAQCWVHGDSLQSALVAVLCLDHDTALPWARRRGLIAAHDETRSKEQQAHQLDLDMEQLCSSARAVQEILQLVQAQGKAAGLLSYEVPKGVHLEPRPFDPNSGLLTATFKIKRNVARQHYAPQIAALYAKITAEAPRERETVKQMRQVAEARPEEDAAAALTAA